jgi:chromosome segregation ATPase
MPRGAPNHQDALRFDERGPNTEQAAAERSEDIADGRRRPGRARVWESDAERKRAYSERLAADFAEPDRLRKELRAERRLVAETEREVTRLKRELARAEDATGAALSRQADLQRMVEGLEMKVADWRSRAQALARKREEERSEREAIDRRRASKPVQKPRLELPNLATKGRPPGA